MALLGNRGPAQRKPYSIDEIQKKAPVAGAVNTDTINAGKRFINNATRVTGGQLLQTGVNAVSDTHARNQRVVNGPDNSRFRTARGEGFNKSAGADNMLVVPVAEKIDKSPFKQIYNAPAQLPNKTSLSDTTGANGRLTRGTWRDDEMKSRIADVMDSQPQQPQPQSGIAQNTAQSTKPRVARAGNMDVSFDKSVLPEARERFLAKPIYVPAQRTLTSSGVVTGRKGNGSVVSGVQGLAFTKENSPQLGWKSRLALNERSMSDTAAMERERFSGENQLVNTRLTGQNNLATTDLNGQYGLKDTEMRGDNQLAVTEANNASSDSRFTRKLEFDYQQSRALQEHESSRDRTKVASDAFLAGVDGGGVQQIQNSTPDKINYKGLKVPLEVDKVVPQWKAITDEMGNTTGYYDPVSNEQRAIPQWSGPLKEMGLHNTSPSSLTEAQQAYLMGLGKSKKQEDQVLYQEAMKNLRL